MLEIVLQSCQSVLKSLTSFRYWMAITRNSTPEQNHVSCFSRGSGILVVEILSTNANVLLLLAVQRAQYGKKCGALV